jgi:hypothetical protein
MATHHDFVLSAIRNHNRNFPEIFYALGNVSHELCQQFLEQALHVDNAFVLDFFWKKNVSFKNKHYFLLLNEREKNNCLEYFLDNVERKNYLMCQKFYCMGVNSPAIFQACRVLPRHYIQHFWSHFDINCKNEQSATPLFAAIDYCNFETVRYLIQDCGADIYSNYFSYTPLEFAFRTREFLYTNYHPNFSNEIEIEKAIKTSTLLLMFGANWPQNGFPTYFNYYPLCLLLYCFQHKSVSESFIISTEFDIFFHL